MSTTSNTYPTRFQILRDKMVASIEKRANRKTLERELASYRTKAERDELDAMLSRGRPEQVAELRQIINRQRSMV